MKVQNLKPFLFSFSPWRVKGFSSKRTALKLDVLQDRKIYCLQALPCVSQQGNFTGWGSEGVNLYPKHHAWILILGDQGHAYHGHCD